MTTVARPAAAAQKIPAHGTQSRYKGPRNKTWEPCRCQPCIRAHTRACSLRQLAHLAGQPPLHDAGPVLEHIQLLNASGMRNDLIARRAGVSHSTVNYLTRGITQRLRRENALKILAVLPGDFDDIAYRPALGSIRRIRALYAIGHSPRTIAIATGLERATVSNIAHGHYQQLSGRVARAIAHAYQQLRVTPGPSRKARMVARREGWPSPIAWDGNIDDPDALPDLEGATTTHIEPKRDKHRNEEIRHLASYGIPHAEIATRVGLARANDVTSRLTEWAQAERDARKQAAS